ncbi:MAG: bifunctional 3-deoxy-7-phosphoheptulonate synthase/chorismate mutase type II [Bacteroidales bacterium]|nr:bifunctional 3-deoxy-7-phosphoheptulonate synthase/chorismate mutase type II [Bacteroidales bacterium]
MGVNLDLEPFVLEGLQIERPFIIAGPCSAESEEQMLITARALAEQGIKVFRAGIWKPRTRPNAFEGVGSKGLAWLKTVKQETGMFTATEVASVKHVYEALKFNVDILWLGARTTANPFAVQEIADTLSGVDIPVLIKNPVNPDVELWIGAIERLNRSGIKKLAAIHRGFSTFGESGFRNKPQWQIPIELKRRIPDIPLITDPSHICGQREGLYEIAQEAMDLSFEGLIIESHFDPQNALSDPQQQLTPADLKKLIEKLVLRSPDMNNGLSLTIGELRAQIDNLDDKIIDIFEKRMKIADEIGHYKKKSNVAILQSKRWDDILNKRLKMGEERGLGNEFISRVFRAIHQESINHQNKIMNEDPETE